MTQANPPHFVSQNQALGMGYMVLAILLFSLMDATAKGLVQTYDPAQVIWIRFVGQVLFTLCIVRFQVIQTLKTQRPVLHFMRGLMQLGAITFFFLALRHIDIAEATAIADINPLLITLGAAVFLGEKLGPRRLFGVCAAMCGALIIIRPGSDSFTIWAIFPALCAVCYSANALLTRKLGPSESPWTAMLWGPLVAGILSSWPAYEAWRPIAGEDLPFILLLALFGSAAQMFLIRSFSICEAGAVAPFSYAGIVFATIWGILFFNTWPDAWTVFGALVIVAAGLYVWSREMKASKGKANRSQHG